MHISVQRSGGFANIGARGEIDTSKLAGDIAEKVQRLVKSAALPAEPPAPLRTRNAADVYQYDITVDGKTYRADELSMPDAWRALADFVLQHS